MLSELSARLQLVREPVSDWRVRHELVTHREYSTVSISELEFSHKTQGMTAGSALLSSDEAQTQDSLASTAFQEGFTWDAADGDLPWWMPQGITGTADASAANEWEGERYLIVSWHSEFDPAEDVGDPAFDGAPEAIRRGDELARITVVKVTDGFDQAPYRHVLLVEPFEKRTGATGFSAITSHAGGIVWHGRYLFVASARRLLIFDLTTIFDLEHRLEESGISHVTPRGRVGSILSVAAEDVDTDRFGTMGFRYVCPLYLEYTLVETDEFGASHFATLGLDRSVDPPRLLSAQFVDVESERFDHDIDHAVVAWWSLDAATGLLDDPTAETVTCARLVATGEEFIQGVNACGNHVWLSGGMGLVHRFLGFSIEDTGYAWPHGAESLHYSPSSDHLWCLNEFAGVRAVWCINRNDAWPFWWLDQL